MTLEDLLQSKTDHSLQPQQECALTYIRVSHERSAEKNISPETQRRGIDNHTSKQSYEVLESFTDLAKSAFKDDDKRIEFHRMIARAKADPRVTVIVVYKYDRFSRGKYAKALQDELLEYGVRIESATEPYNDPNTMAGAIMAPLTWSLSHWFSVNLRNLTIDNMKTNFEQRDPKTGWAYKNGGWAMFGYKTERIKVGRNDKYMDVHKAYWVLDDREVNGKPIWQWARTMLLEWRLKQKLGIEEIAARLTANKIPTPSGKTAWSSSTIQAIVCEWTRLFQYSGIAFWNKEDCSDRNNRKKRDTSEWIVVKNAHPTIISEAECEAIYQMVANRKNVKYSPKTSRWALTTGKLVCANCGANYVGSVHNKRDYYVCGSYSYRRGADCPAPAWYIQREDLENYVLEQIIRLVSKSDAEHIQEWADIANKSIAEYWDELDRTRPARRRKLSLLRKRVDNLVNAIAEYGSNVEIHTKFFDLQAQLKELEDLDKMVRPEPITVEEVQGMLHTAKAMAESTNPEARKKVLRQFIVQISADGANKTLSGEIAEPKAFYSECKGVLNTNRCEMNGGPKGTCNKHNVYARNSLKTSIRFKTRWSKHHKKLIYSDLVPILPTR